MPYEVTIERVSVEPLPKQGCERALREQDSGALRLSGTPAEAGVRVFCPCSW